MDTIKHLLLVTAGLDSMFLGEREVLSQVKRLTPWVSHHRD
ncbi:hypothetical protein [Vulcanisaeta sp. JCM 16159]